MWCIAALVLLSSRDCLHKYRRQCLAAVYFVSLPPPRQGYHCPTSQNRKIEGQHVTNFLFLTSITSLVLAVANPPGHRAKMEYLLRFIQTHETFRLPEIQALADLEGIDMEVISYSLGVRTPHPPTTYLLTPPPSPPSAHSSSPPTMPPAAS